VKHFVRSAGIAILIVALFVLVAVMVYAPLFPHSLKGWAALLGLGLPLALLMEVSGEWSFERFVKSWPMPYKAIFGMLWIAAFVAVFAYPLGFVIRLIQS
jgi:hypothetical protein